MLCCAAYHPDPTRVGKSQKCPKSTQNRRQKATKRPQSRQTLEVEEKTFLEELSPLLDDIILRWVFSFVLCKFLSDWRSLCPAQFKTIFFDGPDKAHTPYAEMRVFLRKRGCT